MGRPAPRGAPRARVDPTIKLADGDSLRGWELTSGWVPIVNRLHVGLVDLLGDYELVRASNKMSALRYAIDRYRRDVGGPDVWEAVNDLLQAAKSESLSTCDLCGAPARGKLSFGVTRREAHQSTPEHTIHGALARPPGWRPTAGSPGGEGR